MAPSGAEPDLRGGDRIHILRGGKLLLIAVSMNRHPALGTGSSHRTLNRHTEKSRLATCHCIYFTFKRMYVHIMKKNLIHFSDILNEKTNINRLNMYLLLKFLYNGIFLLCAN